jgi:hypothetical protein
MKPLYRKTLLRFLPIVFDLERANQLSLLPDKDLADLCPLIEPYQVTKNRILKYDNLFYLKKNLSVSFWGVQWEFPLHPLPLRPVSLIDLVELFFLLNGSFPIVKAFFPSYLQSDI